MQLISYIAPGAPATRRPAKGKLPYLRPEIGFTPKWYNRYLGISFGEKWHFDPHYRRQTRLQMYAELEKRFPGAGIGRLEPGVNDVLTGTWGASLVAAIFGVLARFADDQWPVSEHQYLTEEEIENLTPPDLDNNPVFAEFLKQVETIAAVEGKVAGFMNWQGVLNNAQRLRGQDLFMDLFMAPERTKHLFDCVCTTMMDAAKRLQEVQKKYDKEAPVFFTVSNCLVNMVDPDLYREFLLPFDQRIAEEFGTIGIHNCAWSATPYLADYARMPNIGYLDMGMDSELEVAKKLFPETRRAIMYTPMDVANKSTEEIKKDMEYIAAKFGPCDIVAADIEHGTPDEKVLDMIHICEDISEKYGE